MAYQRRSVGGNGLYGYAKRMIGVGSIEKKRGINTDLCKILSRSLATASLSSAMRCSSVVPRIWVSSSSRYCSITKRTSC